MTVRRCMTRDVTCNQRYLQKRTNTIWRVVMPYRKDRKALMELCELPSVRRQFTFRELRDRFEGPLT